MGWIILGIDVERLLQESIELGTILSRQGDRSRKGDIGAWPTTSRQREGAREVSARTGGRPAGMLVVRDAQPPVPPDRGGCRRRR